MKIREWFGFNEEYNETTEINICVDNLLDLYSKALMKYFSFQSESIDTIMKLDPEHMDKGQVLFKQWLFDKGYPYLKELSGAKLPNDQQLISKIEYDKYILEEEMDFEYPEEVRSSLIGIVCALPEYISAANEQASTFNNYDQLTIRNDLMNEIFPDKNKPTFSVTKNYKLRGFDQPVSNYKESATIAGSLFFVRRNYRGYIRVLQIN
jgi:hypothetical protein